MPKEDLLIYITFNTYKFSLDSPFKERLEKAEEGGKMSGL